MKTIIKTNASREAAYSKLPANLGLQQQENHRIAYHSPSVEAAKRFLLKPWKSKEYELLKLGSATARTLKGRAEFGTPPSQCGCGFRFAPGSVVRLSDDGTMKCCNCGAVLKQACNRRLQRGNVTAT